MAAATFYAETLGLSLPADDGSIHSVGGSPRVARYVRNCRGATTRCRVRDLVHCGILVRSSMQISTYSAVAPLEEKMKLSPTEQHQCEMRYAFHDGAPGILVSGLVLSQPRWYAL